MPPDKTSQEPAGRSENRTLRRHRLKRAQQRRNGLQYDEAGRPLETRGSGLTFRVQRLLRGY